MASSSKAQVTINFENADLDDEALQKTTQNLAKQIREVDGVVQAGLVAVEETAIPAGAKAEGGYLLGVLQAIVDPKSLINLLKLLGERLSGGAVKIKVKMGDKEVEIEASSQKSLLAAEETVNRFLAQQQSRADG